MPRSDLSLRSYQLTVVNDYIAITSEIGKATATCSDVVYNADGSITLKDATRWLSRFDAMQDAERRLAQERTTQERAF